MNKSPKIKLIFPCQFEVNNSFPQPIDINLPYGMGVVTSYLKTQNIYVEQDDLSAKFSHKPTLLDLIIKSQFNIKRFRIDFMNFFQTDQPCPRLEGLLSKVLDSTSIKGFDIIGFSIFSNKHFLFALLLSRKIKKYTNTPIVFGGPFITLYGQLYPDAFKFIDFMITGDGGAPLSQLAHCLVQEASPEHIPGLIYKHNNNLTVVPRDRYPIEDMPMPDFAGLPLDLYRIHNSYKDICIPYQISRGCNGACSFCETKNMNPFLEYKSHHKVVTELQQLKEKYGSNFFHFCDNGAINTSDEYLEGLCDAFIDNKIGIHWDALARIKHLDRAILEKMKLAGCRKLYLGVESGSDRMLELMHKGATVAQTEAVLKDAAELGIQNSVLLISGYPHEQEEDIKNTVDFIRRNKKYLWFVNSLALQVRYGTDLWKHPERHGITNLLPFSPFNFIFSFDEIGGLRWQEKQVQQMRSDRQIKRAIRNYLTFRLLFFMLLQKLRYFMKPDFISGAARNAGDR